MFCQFHCLTILLFTICPSMIFPVFRFPASAPDDPSVFRRPTRDAPGDPRRCGSWGCGLRTFRWGWCPSRPEIQRPTPSVSECFFLSLFLFCFCCVCVLCFFDVFVVCFCCLICVVCLCCFIFFVLRVVLLFSYGGCATPCKTRACHGKASFVQLDFEVRRF